MKKQSKSLVSLCVALLCASAMFTGCSNEENSPVRDESNNGRVALRVNSGILTRAAGDEWSEDDAIGIYMVNTGTKVIAEDATNRRYTAAANGTSTAFNPAGENNIIYYPVSGDEVDFLLYYPQQELVDNTYFIDVSNQSDLPSIDLMAAKVTNKDKTSPAISPNFSHLLTRLELIISAGVGVTSEDLKNLEVRITNQRVKGSYNVLTETMTIDANQSTTSIIMNTNVSGTSSKAILLPTTADGINPVITDRELVFKLSATNEEFKWSMSDDKQLEAGKSNKYTITVDRTELGLTATIKGWEQGNGDGESGSAE